PTKKRPTVAREVAFETSMASMRWRESRLDSYRPKEENRECQSTIRAVNSAKLRTEVRIARNSVSETAPRLLRTGREATMNEPARSAISKNLKSNTRIDR